jgi:hypothetical protein
MHAIAYALLCVSSATQAVHRHTCERRDRDFQWAVQK